jgi:hypothetical protein
MYTKFHLENLKERDHFRDRETDVKITPKRTLNKYGARVWSASVCIKISITGELLRTQ